MRNSNLTILALGDVFGKPGRQALRRHLETIVKESQIDFVIANGENASGGLGITSSVADSLLNHKIDVLTSGNHIWRHREITSFLDDCPRILRPANYPNGTPGRGSGIYEGPQGVSIGVINLEGVLFMTPLACPFKTADQEIDNLRQKTSIIIVDFHAEATSEKRALGYYLDGRVSALVGTHTHIPTADAEILQRGTGYLTDLGMCGPTDSVIGIRKEQAISRFTSKIPCHHQVARDRVQIQGAIIDIDTKTGHCTKIVQRIWPVDD
jgi:metallophosphoesterase (TIGR00282 family)